VQILPNVIHVIQLTNVLNHISNGRKDLSALNIEVSTFKISNLSGIYIHLLKLPPLGFNNTDLFKIEIPQELVVKAKNGSYLV